VPAKRHVKPTPEPHSLKQNPSASVHVATRRSRRLHATFVNHIDQCAFTRTALAAFLDVPNSEISSLLHRGVPHTAKATQRIELLARLLQWSGPLYAEER